MMGGITAGDVAVVIALLTFAALHFFRSPNRQYDDISLRIDRAENAVAALRDEVKGLALKLAGEHFTRAEIKEMLKEMREAVDRVQGVVDRLVESQHKDRPRHG